LSWLYQPAVRTFRVRLYGDDVSFLQAGLPAVFASDSSFTAFYPYYHQAEDTADKIDAPSLARMGNVALAVVEGLVRAPRGPASEPTWFAAFGYVVGAVPLLILGALSVVPGLAADRGRRFFNLRLAQAAVFGLLLWRHPVPALWIFLVANVVTALPRRRWTAPLALLPLALLLALGAAAWRRGFVAGLWVTHWEMAAAALAMVLLFAGAARKPAGAGARTRKGLPGRPGRRVLR
jgi:hypothetical protein